MPRPRLSEISAGVSCCCQDRTGFFIILILISDEADEIIFPFYLYTFSDFSLLSMVLWKKKKLKQDGCCLPPWRDGLGVSRLSWQQAVLSTPVHHLAGEPWDTGTRALRRSLFGSENGGTTGLTSQVMEFPRAVLSCLTHGEHDAALLL